MGQELMVREANQPALLPSEHELQVYMVMAEGAADSKYYQSLGQKPGILSIMLYARELGIAPMTAISGGFHYVQGKVEMSAQMMNRLIRQAGHGIECLEATDTMCRIKGTRLDTGETMIVSFGIEDARRQQLVKKDGAWEKDPADMCWARAISRLKRRLFPDVGGESYVFGEIVDDEPRPRGLSKAHMQAAARMQATAVVQQTQPTTEEPKAALPSPEKPPVEPATPKPEAEPVKRGRPTKKPQGVTAPPFDEPPPPTEEPPQTPMGLSAEKEAPPQRTAKTGLDVWEGFAEYCDKLKGSPVAGQGMNYAFALVQKRFALPPDAKMSDFPQEMIPDLRLYLSEVVIPEMQKETWLPMTRAGE